LSKRPPYAQNFSVTSQSFSLQLLDDVDRGDTVIITRNGRAIARLVADRRRSQTEIDEAIESIKALGRRTGKIAIEELLSARHQDR
jgi:antitoxin (DNA-binding transcriptional repressor) of toxin-antitoxin stability system